VVTGRPQAGVRRRPHFDLDLYTIHVDGSGRRKLSSDRDSLDRDPDWRTIA